MAEADGAGDGAEGANGADGPPAAANGAAAAGRKLDPRWKEFRQDVAWRCRWLERRILELKVQEHHYASLENLEEAQQRAREAAAKEAVAPAPVEAYPLAEPNPEEEAPAEERAPADPAASCARTRPYTGIRRYQKRRKVELADPAAVGLPFLTDLLGYLAPVPKENRRKVPLDGSGGADALVLEGEETGSLDDAFCDTAARAELLLSTVQQLRSHLAAFKAQPTSKKAFVLQPPETASGVGLLSYWQRGLSSMNQQLLNDAPWLKRKAGYDGMDTTVLPHSGIPLATTATPLKVEFINTPKVRDVGYVDDLVKQRNGSAPPGRAEEDTAEEAYVQRHKALEAAEQARFAAVSGQVTGRGQAGAHKPKAGGSAKKAGVVKPEPNGGPKLGEPPRPKAPPQEAAPAPALAPPAPAAEDPHRHSLAGGRPKRQSKKRTTFDL